MSLLMSARDLRFAYDGPAIISGAGFELREGELLAVIGPNGSGKSTLLGLAGGLLRPAAGSVELLGRDVRDYNRAGLSRLMAYVPSEFYLPYDFSVLEIVRMGRSPHVPWWRDYSESDSKRALAALGAVGISALSDRGVNTLSSGERQLAFLAQALAQDPKVLLLDEPTSHLDINYKLRVFDVLTRLTAGGLGVIAVSHDLALLSEYAGKAVLLGKGGQAFYGSAKDALSPGRIAEAYGISDPASIARLPKFC
jgi:iron complex transport system ATP-binding protein